MNRIRVFTSGGLFLFALFSVIQDPTLPFSLPHSCYIIAFLYFAFFPIKDMIAACNNTLYKGRQFQKNYLPEVNVDNRAFQKLKKTYDRRACLAMLFWLIFLCVPGYFYLSGSMDRSWIFFFFALSNFSVFFAIFGWCPFHSIIIKPECCMECRIYNWDSFFQYSFLIFLPNTYTLTLVFLGVLSLLQWEIQYARHPEHFYKLSNANLSCQLCDLEACRHHKKKIFHKTLKEEYREG